MPFTANVKLFVDGIETSLGEYPIQPVNNIAIDDSAFPCGMESAPEDNQTTQNAANEPMHKENEVQKRRKISSARTMPYKAKTELVAHGSQTNIQLCTNNNSFGSQNLPKRNQREVGFSSPIPPNFQFPNSTMFNIVLLEEPVPMLLTSWNLSQMLGNIPGENKKHKLPVLLEGVTRSPWQPCKDNQNTGAKGGRDSQIKVVQTRSGRVSKPPANRVQHLRYSAATDNVDQHPMVMNSIADVVSMTFRKGRETEKENSDGRRKPKIQPKHRCGTCKKTYLGRRMRRHLLANPTHVTLDKLQYCDTDPITTPEVALPGSSPCTDFSPLAPVLRDCSSLTADELYQKLVLRVTSFTTEHEQIAVMLQDISQFVKRLRALVPRLIAPREQEGNEAVYVDQNVADVLQLNRGNYRFRMDTFLQELRKIRRNTGSGDENSVTETVDIGVIEHDTQHSASSYESEQPTAERSSIEAILDDIGFLNQLQRDGLFLPLPLPSSTAVPGTTDLNDPVALSNQGMTAFGRPCQLSEDLFPSQPRVLEALEEGLTDLSELCSPQVLGVPGGTSNVEPNTALNYY